MQTSVTYSRQGKGSFRGNVKCGVRKLNPANDAHPKALPLYSPSTEPKARDINETVKITRNGSMSKSSEVLCDTHIPGLPCLRQFLTSLLKSLSEEQRASVTHTRAQRKTTLFARNHDDGDSRRHRILLTLHVLLPNLLLPALDLLDRRLVTRVKHIKSTLGTLARQDGTATESEGGENRGHASDAIHVYIVRSVAPTGGRRNRKLVSSSSPKSYVVRLQAWNCSCASFALNAFPAHALSPFNLAEQPQEAEESASPISFGGLSLSRGGEDVPCCKHLLACLLAEMRCGPAEDCLEERTAMREELAGIMVNC